MKYVDQLIVGAVILGAIVLIGVLMQRDENQRIDSYVVRHNCVDTGKTTPRTNLKIITCGTQSYTERDIIDMYKKESNVK